MDITTISDLLNEFVSAEKEILNKESITHPTTIGCMFEGLTENILKKSIFKGLNLRVIKNSFIVGCNTEFDVMLVEGVGEQIPHTDRYKYNSEQVIAIIQVKKNLYSKDIKEGFKNLQFLKNNFKTENLEDFEKRLFRDAFRSICKKDITANSISELSENEDFIFHTLKDEAILPVRIIWGYNGFTSEFRFRESFCQYIEDNLTTDFNFKKNGFGPHNFPSLILCGQYSMIKQNGMPFGSPTLENNWWPFYTSSSYNPTRFFLETIWTRLSYKFKQLPMKIFGEDLTLEPINRFLDCRIGQRDENYGWEYNYFIIKDEQLKQNIEITEWKPVELNRLQFIIINKLGKDEEIDFKTDKEFEQTVMRSGLYGSITDFLEEIKRTELVYIEGNKLKLLTTQCECVFLPNGKCVAGENKSGRLTNWVMKETAK